MSMFGAVGESTAGFVNKVGAKATVWTTVWPLWECYEGNCHPHEDNPSAAVPIVWLRHDRSLGLIRGAACVFCNEVEMKPNAGSTPEPEEGMKEQISFSIYGRQATVTITTVKTGTLQAFLAMNYTYTLHIDGARQGLDLRHGDGVRRLHRPRWLRGVQQRLGRPSAAAADALGALLRGGPAAPAALLVLPLVGGQGLAEAPFQDVAAKGLLLQLRRLRQGAGDGAAAVPESGDGDAARPASALPAAVSRPQRRGGGAAQGAPAAARQLPVQVRVPCAAAAAAAMSQPAHIPPPAP
jgi:hypothetical protein